MKNNIVELLIPNVEYFTPNDPYVLVSQFDCLSCYVNMSNVNGTNIRVVVCDHEEENAIITEKFFDDIKDAISWCRLVAQKSEQFNSEGLLN